MKEFLRVVFDTNVLLSATLWSGSVSQKLLLKLIAGDAQIFCSTEILEEYARVLGRDFEYSRGEINEITGKVLEFAAIVEPKFSLRVVENDPDDNKIVECAVASFSEYIVTYDKHLLKIGCFKQVKMLTPEQLLKTIA